MKMMKEDILKVVNIIIAFLIGVVLYSVVEEVKAIRKRKQKKRKTINKK